MIEAILTVIGTALLAVIGWAFHLNSRVAVLEADKVGLRELLAAKLEAINLRLEYIQKRLDRKEESEDK